MEQKIDNIENDEELDVYDDKIRRYFVYEFRIVETGEIYYVGYDAHSDENGLKPPIDYLGLNSYVANEIKNNTNTQIILLFDYVTEREAIRECIKEINMITRKTNFMLCNYINCRISDAQFKKNTTPELVTLPVYKHYLNHRDIQYDKPKIENLKTIFILENGREWDIFDKIYNNEFGEKYEKLLNIMNNNNINRISGQYTKHCTAWVYCGIEYVEQYKKKQKKAKELLGHEIPTYHMIDVLNLFEEIGLVEGKKSICDVPIIDIHPVNNRCNLSEIENLYDFKKAFQEGFPYYELGEEARKTKDFSKAIYYFDKAREKGYDNVYESYAMLYRKIKDYENEIAIYQELIERMILLGTPENSILILKIKEKINKSIALLQKSRKLKY